MVQWFKSLLLRWLQPKATFQATLTYNVGELSAKMEKASMEFHKHKGDELLNLIKLAIETARNIQILEVQKIKQGKDFTKDFAYHLGRLEALSDLGSFIELSLDDYNYDQLRGRKVENTKRTVLKKNYGSVGPVI